MRRISLLVGLVILAATAAACRSGEGERCQTSEDCADGLICVRGTETCEKSARGDAAIDPDAPPIDANVPDGDVVVPDAGPDAAPDAAPDAMPDAL